MVGHLRSTDGLLGKAVLLLQCLLARRLDLDLLIHRLCLSQVYCLTALSQVLRVRLSHDVRGLLLSDGLGFVLGWYLVPIFLLFEDLLSGVDDDATAAN